MVVVQHVADYRKIMKGDCMVFLCKLEKMIFLKPLSTGDRQHDNKNEIRDEKSGLDRQRLNAHNSFNHFCNNISMADRAGDLTESY